MWIIQTYQKCSRAYRLSKSLWFTRLEYTYIN